MCLKPTSKTNHNSNYIKETILKQHYFSREDILQSLLHSIRLSPCRAARKNDLSLGFEEFGSDVKSDSKDVKAIKEAKINGEKAATSHFATATSCHE